MTFQQQYKFYQKLFDDYAGRFDQSDGRVALKIIHTKAVVSVMEMLCIKRRLPEYTKHLAMLCALFHDIGRFEQLKRYSTFLDHMSCNHAELGCKILQEEAILKDLPPKDQEKILTAIRNHNRYEIDPKLQEAASSSSFAAETVELCRLIRDADKCDIFRVFACDDMEDVIGASEETVAAQTITPEVFCAALSHKTVDKAVRKTYLDFWVGFLAFFFDLNYPESVEIAKEQGYYRKPFDRTKFLDPQAEKQVREILRETETYIRQVLDEKKKSGRETVPENLRKFFQEHPKMALAFSGGTDSAYLLYAASVCGCQVQAYYVSTPFQPQFELDDARRLARTLSAPMKLLPFDVLTVPEVKGNPKDRCYHCKNRIFSSILNAAGKDGYSAVMDGTNASDDAGDRPGMRALKELKVWSPLRHCGITKSMVREYSRNAGLFTWDKPAYACLATRIPVSVPIEREVLKKVEWAEEQMAAMGFSDFRVRVFPEPAMPGAWAARLQITEPQLSLLLARKKEIFPLLRQEFSSVLLDLELRSPSVDMPKAD